MTAAEPGPPDSSTRGRSISRAGFRKLLWLPLFAAPLVVPSIVPLQALPPALAYTVTEGRWLVLVGLALAALALLFEDTRFDPVRWTVPTQFFPRAIWPGLFVAAVAVAWQAVPPERWPQTKFSGDEPKYLRLADSLYHDLDVDLEADTTSPVDGPMLRRNVRDLFRATRDALVDLARDPFPDTTDGGGSAGHWAVRGRHGGVYQLQSPGLPILLLPARLLQPFVDPDRPNSLALVTLVLLWALAFVNTVRLAAALAGSDWAGLAAGLLVACAAPLLAGGLHFYPETACAAAVPWLARWALPGPEAPRITLLRAACLGLVAGALPWLHPKFALLSAVALCLGAWRLRGARRALALYVLGAALALAALLLFDHHVTGLLRPDALYVRAHSSVYSGLGDFAGVRTLLGLGIAFFGARDGLLVMAPIAIAGLLALPWLWRHARPGLVVLSALFVSLWIAAAVHEGGAPGPPGRLLAPVLPLLAPALAIGFVALGQRRSYRWTVGLLAVVGLSITLSQLGSWHREVDPYDGVFPSAAVNFAHDLPDGPRGPGETPTREQPGREASRMLLLTAAVAGWAAAFARHRAAQERLPRASAGIGNFYLGAWGTLALLSAVLHAL